MNPCPACGSDKVKPRSGSLGESKGVWCTQCGHAADSEASWDAQSLKKSTQPLSVDMSSSKPKKPWNWPIDGTRLENLAWNYKVARNPGESDYSLSERVWKVVEDHLIAEDNAIGL